MTQSKKWALMARMFIVGLTALALALTGCDKGTNSTPGTGGGTTTTGMDTGGATTTTTTGLGCGVVPYETLQFKLALANAKYDTLLALQSCQEDVKVKIQNCIGTGMGDETTCPLKFAGDLHACDYAHDSQVNKLIVAAAGCDVEIFVIPTWISPSDYATTPNTMSGDVDKDNLSPWTEWLIGSHPCIANSLDPCKSDGDGDADGDGIINKNDQQAPTCPGMDPSACGP